MGFVMDADAVASFRRDGFVAIEGLVQEPEIARLRSMLMDLHERNAGFEEGAQFDAAAPDDESETRRFPQILNPHHFEPRLLATGYHQVGLQIARQLLGATARFRCAVSFLKPAHIGSGVAGC